MRLSYKRGLAMIVAGLCLLAVPMTSLAGTDYGFSARVYGPGVNNLSSGDIYAQYQWGLRNDGELQYLEIVNKFRSSDPDLAEEIDLANQLGQKAPIEGPDAYEIETITSRKGIDINIQPAWELYDRTESERRKVIVAVIDTGIDIRHPELQDSI